MWARIADALNGIYGVHSGHRVIHAKGTLCAGTFTATPEAARLTTAAHLQGRPVKAHIRFSNAGGDPTKRDGTNDSRGMAVKFYLDDGSTTDISSVTIPVFVVRTPEDFLEFTLARQPDPETGKMDLEKIGAFLSAHPESNASVEAAMMAQAPASYLNCPYFAVHAFRFVDPSGGSRWVRYRWEPEGGVHWLSKDEAKAQDPDYLRTDLQERLAREPAGFRLFVKVATGDDDVDDPTTAWPTEREEIEVGHLEITGLAFDRENDGDVLVFDPTRVTEGIECSNDPILNARPHAYEESVFRRSGLRRS
jgi:catalase